MTERYSTSPQCIGCPRFEEESAEWEAGDKLLDEELLVRAAELGLDPDEMTAKIQAQISQRGKHFLVDFITMHCSGYEEERGCDILKKYDTTGDIY